MFRFWSFIALTAVSAAVAIAMEGSSCEDEGVALQVLGSGGPVADDARASSGYLLWIDGKARVLLDGSEGFPKLQVIEIDAHASKPVDVFSSDAFEVQAAGVHHSIVPTLGYLITVSDQRIAISGDQNLSTDYFTRMVAGADLLVMPMAIPEYDEPDVLHARPSDIGKMAARAQVKKLVLSHWMARSLADQDKNIDLVSKHYDGPIQAASDLMCVPIKAKRR